MRRGGAEELGIKLDRLLKRVGVEGGLRGQLPPKEPRFAALQRAQERYERARAINTLFGRAVKEWRVGDRAQSVVFFEQYMSKYPKSPWSGEAALHLGYAAKKGGRLIDAQNIFQEVLDNTSDKINRKLRKQKRARKARGVEVTDAEREADIDKALGDATSFEEAVSKLDSAEESDDDDESFQIHLKAKQQLADIEIAIGHFGDAADKLSEIVEEDTDWHRRVWARAQLQRANLMASKGAPLMACGPQALGMVMVGFHKDATAEKVKTAVATNVTGFSMAELKTLAAKNGVEMRGFRAEVSQLSQLDLPAILHYDFGHDSKVQGKGSGHFVVLQGVDVKSSKVRLFDPLGKRSLHMSYAQLKRQWSGKGLAIDTKSVNQIGVSLSEQAMRVAVGSSTTFASAHDIGDAVNNSSVGVGDGISAPAVSVNNASLNLYIEHTVTNYEPARGPSAAVTLSYNSDASDTFDYSGVVGVGRKWTFNFSSISHLNDQDANVNTTGSLIETQMPDGSQDLYHWDQAEGRYVGEKGNFNWINRVNADYSPDGNKRFIYKLNFLDGGAWTYIGDSYSSVVSEMQSSLGGSIKIYHNQSQGAGKQINRIVDAEGRTTTFTYGGSGDYSSTYRAPAIKTITDPFGRQTTFSYDPNTGDLSGISDSQGRNFRYTYDAQFSDVKTIELPTINNVAPIWSVDRGGERYLYGNYPNHRWKFSRLTIVDPNGGTQERCHDSQTGRIFYIAPQNYVPAPNTYNPARMTQYNFIYQSDGGLVPQFIQFPDGTSTSYEYERQHDFVSKITDRQGKGTYFTYNSNGQVLTVRDPNGNVTTTTYEAKGLYPTVITRPNPNVSNPGAPNAYTQITNATYNSGYNNLPDTVTDVGGTTTFIYTGWGGDLDTVIDPQGRGTRNIYNSLNLVEQVQWSDKPVGNAARNWVTMQRFVYDGLLRVKDSFDEAGLKTSFQYNNRDRVTVTTYPDGSITQNIYRAGNDDVLVGVRDRAGRTSWVAYDDLGQATITQDANNQFSYMAYDKDGNLKQLTDNKRNVTQWSYDALDRPIGKRYHDGTTEAYAYGYVNFPLPNGRGNLVQTTGTRGQIVKYEYDNNGNQTKIDYPNMPDVTMSYNRLDDVAVINDAIGNHAFGYDDYGRLVSNSGPLNADTQTYVYDELQRVQAQTVERGASGGIQSQTYGYDALGRLTSLNANGTQGTGLTTYSYDGNTDRLRILSHPNGTKADLRYDAYGRQEYCFNGANGNPFHNRYSYTFNANDAKSRMQTRTGDNSVPIASTYYSYDALDQLKQERVEGGVAGTPYTTNYNYDAMGNRLQVDSARADVSSTTTSTPNALNQLTNITTAIANGPTFSANLTYDNAGNLTQSIAPNGSNKTTYTYDDADRLSRIERRGDSGQLLTVSEFGYDYASRRAFTREYDFGSSNGGWANPTIKRRVFDGLDVVQERDANNQVTAQLVRDGNIGGILSRTTADGAAFYGYDGNGNVTLLTNSAGQDVGHYRYGAFGNTLEAEGPRAGENPYRFSTKELHGPSGLYDFGLRFYSPGTGRWINRDPLQEDGGVNLYAMVGNDPINDVDEYGLQKRSAFQQFFWNMGEYLEVRGKGLLRHTAKGGMDAAEAYALRGTGRIAVAPRRAAKGGRIATAGLFVNKWNSRLPLKSLSKQIRQIHSAIPKQGSYAWMSKNRVSMRQLRTLTQHTGDEYMMFSVGSQRLVIRGSGSKVTVTGGAYNEVIKVTILGGRYSGHTHPPGYSLTPGPADAPFLRSLGQKTSGIWGSGTGRTGVSGWNPLFHND